MRTGDSRSIAQLDGPPFSARTIRQTRHPSIAMQPQRTTQDLQPARGRQPVFCPDRLAARTGQQVATMRTFATLLLEHLPADMKALQDAMRTRCGATIAERAHKIAGTFAALAIDPLVADALAIELAAGAGDLRHSATLVNALSDRCQQVADELTEFATSRDE